MNNLLISGICGRIGGEIKKHALDYGFTCVGGIDKNTFYEPNCPIFNDFSQEIFLKTNEKISAVIDFSSPELAEKALDFCFKNKIPFVCGTTALPPNFYKKATAAAKEIPICVDANFSTTMRAFLKTAKFLNELLPYSDKSIIERHGAQKKDAPSGTALLLNQKIHAAQICSIRGGTAAGEHSALFMCDGEMIKITHEASDKSVFAKGALHAAKLLLNKKVGFFTADDL